MKKSRLGACCVGLVAAVLAMSAPAVDLQNYVRKDEFNSLKLSPGGDYFAATVPLEDRTVLAIIRRSDGKVTGTFRSGRNSHVTNVWWVNPERVLISLAEKNGLLAAPQGTGELFAINADGSGAEILIGQGVPDMGPGTRLKPKKNEHVAGWLIDDLPGDDKSVIIAVEPLTQDPYTQADLMDVYSGRRVRLARAPVANARFSTDNKGVVRFAYGFGTDNARKLFYRDGENTEWRLITDESSTGRFELPVGFSADDRTAFLQVEQASGPDALVALDTATGSREEVLRDDEMDPWTVIRREGTVIPLGVRFMDGRPRTEFLDDSTEEARLQRSLEAAFAGQSVYVTSRSKDGRLALVEVQSDRNPGDFYLFDTVAKKAEHIQSRASWIDPDGTAEMQPVSFSARDGLKLHGYLTLPQGREGKNLPTIIMPHGGPFGQQDIWGFSSEVQMLAEAGYAVLQVNFRGSGGYGNSFLEAGARQWGRAMQDDLTDATHWSVEQGFADAERICIYGASYGGYASLMGVAKEPGLYRCAVGYVGVYDLQMMQREDARESIRVGNWSREWVGDAATLAELSPNRLADRIKVPVFLAAGGEDDVAPIEHSRMMEKALRNVGVPVETLYFDTEGHGFYLEKNRREYYTRLLDFFSRYLGGRTANAAGSTTAKSASAK